MSDLDNPRFRASKDLISQIFTTQYLLAASVEVVDLFDREFGPDDIVREVANFLSEHRDLTDLIFYYCGHGRVRGFDTLCLALRSSREGQIATTMLKFSDFWHDLERPLAGKRTYFLLDCCYAAAALKHLQSGDLLSVAANDIEVKGTALFAATSKDSAAIAPEQQSTTMFSGHVVQAVRRGIAGAAPSLSLAVLAKHVREQMLREHATQRPMPELHSPRQEGGELSLMPLFRNLATADRDGAEARAEDAQAAGARTGSTTSADRRRFRTAFRPAKWRDRITGLGRRSSESHQAGRTASRARPAAFRGRRDRRLLARRDRLADLLGREPHRHIGPDRGLGRAGGRYRIETRQGQMRRRVDDRKRPGRNLLLALPGEHRREPADAADNHHEHQLRRRRQAFDEHQKLGNLQEGERQQPPGRVRIGSWNEGPGQNSSPTPCPSAPQALSTAQRVCDRDRAEGREHVRTMPAHAPRFRIAPSAVAGLVSHEPPFPMTAVRRTKQDASCACACQAETG